MCKYMIEWTNQSNNTDRNNNYGKEKTRKQQWYDYTRLRY